MADVKKEKKEKHSGFDAPPKFEFVPKGYVRKVNKDGTVSYVPPKKAKK